MIVICKDDNTYIACPIKRTAMMVDACLTKSDMLIPENMPVWKVQDKENCLLAIINQGDPCEEISRYATDLFDGELDIFKVKNQVIPAMIKLLAENGFMDENDKYLKNNYIIAQGGKAFLFGGEKMEIEVVDDVCPSVYGIKAASAIASIFKDVPINELVARLGIAIEEISFASDMFPFVITDTKSVQSVVLTKQDAQKLCAINER